jgi:hypothetical protein
MLPYQLALTGLAVAPVFTLRLPFPVVAVFSFDSFSDLVEAALSCLSVVCFAVSFFFAGVVSPCDFFFSGVALGFGEGFFLGLGFGDGFGTALGDDVGGGVAAGIWISLFAGVEGG